jgi:hypothetical protein
LIRTPAFGTDEKVAEGEEAEVVDVVVAVDVAGDVEVSCRLSITASVEIYLMIESLGIFCSRLLCSWLSADQTVVI